MGKVIDITTRIKENKKVNMAQVVINESAEAPMDLTAKIDEKRNKDRRHVERIILNGLFGAKVVIPREGLLKVKILDISSGGLGFEVDQEHGTFKPGDTVAMRIYFNQETYFPFLVKINSVKEVLDEGRSVQRHGAGFASENRDAIDHFVRFLDLVTVGMKTDKGDLLIPGFGG